MPGRDPRVTAYIQERAPFARPILRRLRRAIHESGPGLEETIRWGMPSFLHRGRLLCGFAGFHAHCALWFKDGRAVAGRRPKEAMGQFGRLTSVDDLPSAARLRACVRRAMALIEEGRPR